MHSTRDCDESLAHQQQQQRRSTRPPLDTPKSALQPSSTESTKHLAVRRLLSARDEVNYTAVQIQSMQFIVYTISLL